MTTLKVFAILFGCYVGGAAVPGAIVGVSHLVDRRRRRKEMQDLAQRLTRMGQRLLEQERWYPWTDEGSYDGWR